MIQFLFNFKFIEKYLIAIQSTIYAILIFIN